MSCICCQKFSWKVVCIEKIPKHIWIPSCISILIFDVVYHFETFAKSRKIIGETIHSIKHEWCWTLIKCWEYVVYDPCRDLVLLDFRIRFRTKTPAQWKIDIYIKPPWPWPCVVKTTVLKLSLVWGCVIFYMRFFKDAL